MTTPTFSLVSEDEFLAAHAPGVPFAVEASGDQESLFGKVRAAYFEWVYGKKEGDRLVSFSVGYRSEAAIGLTADGKRASFKPSRVRLYLGPSFEREFRPTDRSAPEVVRERLNREQTPIHVAEYQLQAGKTYQALVFEESFALPPEGPGKPPRRRTSLVLHLSDRPFVGGKPQVEATPGFRGWTH
jgi:hypothetical protein